MKDVEVKKIINSSSDEEIIRLYSLLMKEMKKRKIVRSNNIVGDLGEKIAIDIYNKTRGEVKLQAAPLGTKNVDALSRMGERYSIKTIRFPNRTTGVFWGLNKPESKKPEKRLFEYVIIVELTEYLEPLTVYELT